MPPGRPAADPASVSRERTHRRLDRQRHRVDAQVPGQLPRIVDASAARIGRRHQDPEDVRRADCFRGNGGGERRVDPARKTQHDACEAAFAHVVPSPEHQRAPDFRLHLHVRGRRDRRPAVEIADDDVGVERSSARDRRAGRVERAAAPVEYEIVVAAELIHVDHGHAVLARHVAEHLFTPLVLAGGERRRRQVDDGGRAGADELLDRIVVIAAALPVIAIVPDVLADADAQPPAADVEHLGAVKRLEVAVFVEDVVGGEQRFAESEIDAAVAQQNRGVEERPSFVGCVGFRHADQHRRQRLRLARQAGEHVPAPPHEAGVQQQVARQVADQRQLRASRPARRPRRARLRVLRG